MLTPDAGDGRLNLDDGASADDVDGRQQKTRRPAALTAGPGNVLSRLCSGAQHLIMAAPYIKADALAKVLADVNRSKRLKTLVPPKGGST